MFCMTALITIVFVTLYKTNCKSNNNLSQNSDTHELQQTSYQQANEPCKVSKYLFGTIEQLSESFNHDSAPDDEMNELRYDFKNITFLKLHN